MPIRTACYRTYGHRARAHVHAPTRVFACALGVQKLSYVRGALGHAKKAYDACKLVDEKHHQDTELSIRIMERFKNVQLRSGLPSMEGPVTK